ncbi:guided entry of tail-anchored proteins factor CAMLG isoform X2 [Denticeps clupeoides]|uniref:guided entry of tail-anchored proteins factor CAMLG isoform X2 n=1 Tax=Denticeps clupeoides TaxID=299321 RepID=UPI0010A40749|nr:calcium signal-modulating cyclophilin ligand isoform X2 [Denticeps clupeoides]
MEPVEDCAPAGAEEGSGPSAAQRRAEVRRRKLLMNSEERMNRIVGYGKNDGDGSPRRAVEPRFHLDLERSEPWSSPVSTKRLSPFLSEAGETAERRGPPLPDSRDGLGSTGTTEGDLPGGVRQRARGNVAGDEHTRSPRKGVQKYLSRFDDALKLRSQMASEKTAQESSSDSEELDSFRVFRLIGSAVLALFVRLFVCKYLSIFAPFLTLELAYMGLYKYFPKVEKKAKTTVLTAALLLSGIPAEVISRSMDTYRKMGDVFADLCVYFFTFILSHEVLVLLGSEAP